MSDKPTRRAAGSPKESRPAPINRATAQQIASFVQRADKLYDDIAERQEDLKELWTEAKSLGFDPKELDGIVKLRRKDPENEKIKTSVRDVYLKALQLDLGELGRWARDRDLAESQVRTQGVVATMSAQSEQIVDAFALTRGLDETGAAAARLQGMVREDGGTRTTVSINGGPEVPLETVHRAVKRVKRGQGGGSVIGAIEQAVAEETAEAGA